MSINIQILEEDFFDSYFDEHNDFILFFGAEREREREREKERERERERERDV